MAASVTDIAAARRERNHAYAETRPYTGTVKGSMPGLDRVRPEDVRAMETDGNSLPEFLGDDAEIGAPFELDGARLDADALSPALLRLFVRAGALDVGPRKARHGAPLVLRLAIELFLALRADARDGDWRRLRLPHLKRHERGEEMIEAVAADVARVGRVKAIGYRESVERMLFGDQRWSGAAARWEAMRQAMADVRELSPFLVDGYWRYILFPSSVPASRDAPAAEFLIRVPMAAKSGFRVDRRWLRHYGRRSALAYRLYLVVCHEMGRASSRPDAGSTGGHPQTRLIRLAGADVENPGRRFVRPVSDVALTSAVGLDPTNRSQRRNVRRMLERFEADGILDVEHLGGGGLRLLAPHGTPPAPPEADR